MKFPWYPPPSPVEIDRALVRKGGLLAFVKLVWHVIEPSTPFIENWHHEVLCSELERGGNLVVNVPPRTGKSLIASVAYPVWLWLQDPGAKIASVSYVPSLCMKHAKASRDLILSDFFQARWGHLFTLPKDCAAGDYTNSKGGHRYAVSMGQGITGYHFSVILLDDPLPPLPSKADVEGARDWFGGVRTTRLLAGGSTKIIMQRTHELDPSALGKALGFRHISLPMRAEGKLCKEDPRKPGDLLWPAVHTEASVKEWETSLGPYQTASQLQQKPARAGGSIFRSEWWKHRTSYPAKFDKVVLSIDAAFTGKTSSDYTVIQVWGKVGAELHLLDQDRRQMDMPTSCAAVKAMRRKWSKATAVYIEAAANGFAIEQTLRREGVLGLILVKTGGVDKVGRANAVVHLFAAGNVYLPPEHDAPWLGAWKHELETFPSSAHDDQVDATTMALSRLAGRGGAMPSAEQLKAAMNWECFGGGASYNMANDPQWNS